MRCPVAVTSSGRWTAASCQSVASSPVSGYDSDDGDLPFADKADLSLDHVIL